MTFHIPDFYIIGAQKAGTTSLAALLDSLPGVCFARPKEPLFFSRDEIELHPHFFAEQPYAWTTFAWETQRETLLEKYSRYFSHAQEGDLLGEGSTSYLMSYRAPQRMYELNPQAKIIVLLRDPAKRAWSAYWHYVRTGTACEPFKRHLQYEGGLTVRAGEYAAQIDHWLSVFPRNQYLFLLYEEMIARPEHVIAKTCDFLGLQPPARAALPRENVGQSPDMLWLQLAINHLNRWLGIPQAAIASDRKLPLIAKLIRKVSDWNMSERPTPKMPPDIHQLLDIHYARANSRLPELTGLELSSYWYASFKPNSPSAGTDEPL